MLDKPLVREITKWFQGQTGLSSPGKMIGLDALWTVTIRTAWGIDVYLQPAGGSGMVPVLLQTITGEMDIELEGNG